MISNRKQPRAKLMKMLLQWLALGFLFAGTHALAQSTGTVTYVYTDPQGTPLAETDANGNITATFDYTPYGTYAPNGTSTPGPNPNGPGYTGHVNDPETNLVYMQARYYDSATGHFLSTDPAKPAAGDTFNFNRYGYAKENPILNIDPDGKEPDPFFHPVASILQETGLLDLYEEARGIAERGSDQILSRTSVDAVGTAAWGGGAYYSRPIYNSDAQRAGIVLVGEGLEAKADVTFRLFTIGGNQDVSSPLRFNADFSVHAVVGGHVQLEFDPAGKFSMFVGAGPGLGESFSLLSGGMLLKGSQQQSDSGQSNGSQGGGNGLRIEDRFTTPWNPGNCLCTQNQNRPDASME